jgi:eukaryotic-like serine/threonine-protein kinase
MDITGTLVMAADTVVLSVDKLSDELRRQIQATEGDYAVVRPHSRTTARLVDRDAALLLEEFRQPTTILKAIIRFCSVTKEDPASTLDAAFPMLERWIQARLLVAPDSPQTRSISASLEIGSHFAGTEILECLQTLDDTELYRVKTSLGESAALKLMARPGRPEIDRMFEYEALVLNHLDATVSPKLLTTNAENEFRYLLLSWCPGSDCATVAGRLRSSGDRAALLRLSLAILDAYAHLHAQNVIHSDVHPRNILVDNDLSVRLVDFGLARIVNIENEFRRSQRGGVGYFFEPEYANSFRSNRQPPNSSMLGEQYSLAALLHLLITGKHYVDFSLEKQEMLRQIAEDTVLPFRTRGLKPWPAVEDVLAKALAKDPAARFSSLAAFAVALSCVSEQPNPATSSVPSNGEVTYVTALEAVARIVKRMDLDGPLLRSGLAGAPKASVTCRSAGIACAIHRIACARQDPKLLALADLWGERAARDARRDEPWYSSEVEVPPEKVDRISPYHTQSGVHFIKALIAHSMGDIETQQSALDRFVAGSLARCDNLDLTLGLSGILLAASHLLSALSADSMVNIAALRELGNTTIASVWRQLDSYAPIPECRQIRYSGIAHGWAGILYATLCWSRASGASLPPNTGERLSQLAALARRSGRHAMWNSNVVGEQRDDRGVITGGWCNGSAGQVHLWLSAHSILKDHRYLTLAEQTAWHAADADTKNGSLCCGFAGQSYAMLSLYRKSGERVWLRGAQALAERAAAFYRDLPSARDSNVAVRASSLYKNELGVAVLAADLETPNSSAHPAFEFIEF